MTIEGVRKSCNEGDDCDLVQPAVSGTGEDILHVLGAHLVQGPGTDHLHSGNYIIRFVFKVLCLPERRQGDYDESEDNRHSREDSHSHEPEPQEAVDLLVDDVEGEDAEAVMFGHSSGCSIFVECALGHLKDHQDVKKASTREL